MSKLTATLSTAAAHTGLIDSLGNNIVTDEGEQIRAYEVGINKLTCTLTATNYLTAELSIGGE